MTRYVFIFYSGGISWKVVLQSTTTLSTTEVEHMAAIEAVKEVIWLRGLVGDLELQQKLMTMFCDCLRGIDLKNNPKYHERIKHTDIRARFIQTLFSQGVIAVKKIATAKNPTYMMTYTILTVKFKHCLDLIGIIRI